MRRLDDHLAARYRISELDHGAMVPLYFIAEQYADFKLVHISTAGLPFIDLTGLAYVSARRCEYRRKHGILASESFAQTVA